MANSKKVEPLRLANFGLASHRFQSFDCSVPGDTPQEALVDPGFWVHIATRVNPHDEIRVCAEDDSFVALLHVTYSVGNKIRLKMVYHAEMEAVDYDAMEEDENFEIKQRGVKKWCIIQKSDGRVIEELIPTKVAALIALEGYKKALAA